MAIASQEGVSNEWDNYVMGNIDAFMRAEGFDTLEGQDLSGLTFYKVHFRAGTSFRGADLKGTRFKECTFGEKCDFNGADIEGMETFFCSATNIYGILPETFEVKKDIPALVELGKNLRVPQASSKDEWPCNLG